jgi:transposase
MAAGVVSFIAHYLTLYSCYASIIAYLARFFCLSPVSKSNSNSFYKVLKLFNQDLISEWVKGGNNREDFTEKGSKIVIVLDNASFHKKQDYIQKITTEMPNIHLEYLPEYSPDYNLIELVWHSAKEYIANRLFKSIEKLEFLLHKLLNEGGLVIKWGRKLKNKGNAVITI